MAEENKIHGTTETPQVETQDRGLFDFVGKKHEEKPQEEVIVTEFEKVKVSEPSETKVEDSKLEEGEKKHSLLEKLHRSDSSSSSSSDEEEVEGEEKKKKKKDKKGLKEKIKEKISSENETGKHDEDTTVPVEKCDAEPAVYHDAAASNPEEKKGFLEKIKDKLPGQHKKPEEAPVSSEHATATEGVAHDVEAKEKKGILEKIKEKLPGYHPKTEEEKEKGEKKDDTAH